MSRPVSRRAFLADLAALAAIGAAPAGLALGHYLDPTPPDRAAN